MSETLFNFINASYIVAGVLFILALAGLSKFETSKRGNAFGMVGTVSYTHLTLPTNREV